MRTTLNLNTFYSYTKSFDAGHCRYIMYSSQIRQLIQNAIDAIALSRIIYLDF